MRIALFCGLILSIGSSATVYAQDARRDSVQFRYGYSEGDRLRYRIEFRHGIVDTSNGNTTRGSLRHSFQYLREVQNVSSDNGTATLKITFEQASFDAGTPGGGFDSTNADQLRGAKTNPQWQVWGALLSSTARMRVTPLGEVEFFRLTDMDKDYDDNVRDSVNRVLEENSQYLAARFPSAGVTKGSSWTGSIPVRLLGGALRGNVVFVEGKYTFDQIEKVNGESLARINVTLNKQPNLGLTGESLKGAEADFNVPALSGKLLFSLDRGSILEYDVVVKTHLKLTVDKQPVDDHAMEYEFNLKRLD